MMTLQFADTHNLVAFLTKSAKSEGFEQIVDFLNASSIKYALTVNPTIYTSCIEQFWSTTKAKTVNGKKIFANMKRKGKDFSGRETPLFPTMMVQAQEEMSKGSEMATDPHHTPIITQPSSSQPQRKLKSRRTPKEKDTEIP
ncbi:hypothetical protein Tco_0451171 [Tanacetum coccineum]